MTDRCRRRSKRDDVASAAVATGFRSEALLFRQRARELHTEGRDSEALSLELTAADMTGCAATIERDLRGLPAWPAVQS